MNQLTDERNPNLNELSGREVKPVGESRTSPGLTRKLPSKGASYNKNAILFVLFGILLLFGIAILFSIPVKKSGNSATVPPGEQPVTGSQELTPAELSKLPDSYSGITNGRNDGNGTTLNKQPEPTGQDERLYSSYTNQTGLESDHHDSNSISAPPPVQPIPTGQATVTDEYSGSGQSELMAAPKSPIRFGNDNQLATLNQKSGEGVTGDFNNQTGQLPNQNWNQPIVSTQPEERPQPTGRKTRFQ